MKGSRRFVIGSVQACAASALSSLHKFARALAEALHDCVAPFALVMCAFHTS